MIVIRQVASDEAEARSMLSWRDIMWILSGLSENLRSCYKYSDQPEAVKAYAEELRRELIDDCIDLGIKLD